MAAKTEWSTLKWHTHKQKQTQHTCSCLCAHASSHTYVTIIIMEKGAIFLSVGMGGVGGKIVEMPWGREEWIRHGSSSTKYIFKKIKSNVKIKLSYKYDKYIDMCALLKLWNTGALWQPQTENDLNDPCLGSTKTSSSCHRHSFIFSVESHIVLLEIQMLKVSSKTSQKGKAYSWSHF